MYVYNLRTAEASWAPSRSAPDRLLAWGDYGTVLFTLVITGIWGEIPQAMGLVKLGFSKLMELFRHVILNFLIPESTIFVIDLYKFPFALNTKNIDLFSCAFIRQSIN